MSYTEDDAKWDVYIADTFVEDIRAKIKEEDESKRSEVIADLILDSNREIEPVVKGLVKEIYNLKLDMYPQSKALLCCTLFELIEEELISLPLLAVRFMFSDNHAESIKYLREIKDSKIAHEFIVLKFFQQTSGDKKIEEVFNQLYSKFHQEENLSLVDHRKILNRYRNDMAHGDKYMTVEEAEFIIEFASKWRDLVFNFVLSEFGLKLEGNWQLSFITSRDI
ncbi:hypothetical protein ACJVC5_11465 [Peredibacter sp. HCB2-198]|uniref:hypothetical protein n=1 Tax=Peredibacter sp. HCB2-198 TaxID=3383025 RepID=UPI0038B60A7D